LTFVAKDAIYKTMANETQAQRIVARFGGAPALCSALAAVGTPRHVSVIYRWLAGATRGVVPTSAVPDIMRAADHVGVLLTDADWSPRKQ
jgi:hypothetical protein